MSNTVKQLGFIPTNRGEFDTTGQTRYYKDNVVQYRNGSYICTPVGYSSSNLTAYTTDAPYQDGDTQLNPNWKLMASVGLVDTEPTAGSNNLVKSGGVQNELALGAVYDVSAKNPTAGLNNDGKWESLSALFSDANLSTLIPTAVRKGGMSIKFIQSSDNKYVQYMYKVTDAATVNTFKNVANWEKVNLEQELADIYGYDNKGYDINGNLIDLPGYIAYPKIPCTPGTIYTWKGTGNESNTYIVGLKSDGTKNPSHHWVNDNATKTFSCGNNTYYLLISFKKSESVKEVKETYSPYTILLTDITKTDFLNLKTEVSEINNSVTLLSGKYNSLVDNLYTNGVVYYDDKGYDTNGNLIDLPGYVAYAKIPCTANITYGWLGGGGESNTYIVGLKSDGTKYYSWDNSSSGQKNFNCGASAFLLISFKKSASQKRVFNTSNNKNLLISVNGGDFLNLNSNVTNLTNEYQTFKETLTLKGYVYYDDKGYDSNGNLIDLPGYIAYPKIACTPGITYQWQSAGNESNTYVVGLLSNGTKYYQWINDANIKNFNVGPNTCYLLVSFKKTDKARVIKNTSTNIDLFNVKSDYCTLEPFKWTVRGTGGESYQMPLYRLHKGITYIFKFNSTNTSHNSGMNETYMYAVPFNRVNYDINNVPLANRIFSSYVVPATKEYTPTEDMFIMVRSHYAASAYMNVEITPYNVSVDSLVQDSENQILGLKSLYNRIKMNDLLNGDTITPVQDTFAVGCGFDFDTDNGNAYIGVLASTTGIAETNIQYHSELVIANLADINTTKHSYIAAEVDMHIGNSVVTTIGEAHTDAKKISNSEVAVLIHSVGLDNNITKPIVRIFNLTTNQFSDSFEYCTLSIGGTTVDLIDNSTTRDTIISLTDCENWALNTYGVFCDCNSIRIGSYIYAVMNFGNGTHILTRTTNMKDWEYLCDVPFGQPTEEVSICYSNGILYATSRGNLGRYSGIEYDGYSKIISCDLNTLTWTSPIELTYLGLTRPTIAAYNNRLYCMQGYVNERATPYDGKLISRVTRCFMIFDKDLSLLKNERITSDEGWIDMQLYEWGGGLFCVTSTDKRCFGFYKNGNSRSEVIISRLHPELWDL